jgi:phytoene dehydrogenase-like protein
MSARCSAPRSCAIWNCRARPAGHPYEGGAVFTRDGDYLASYRDHDAHRREFARFSKRDAEAYDRYARDVTRQCRFIQPLLMRTAPDPFSFKPRDIGELMYLGKRFGASRPEQMAATLRFWTMSISDFLDEYFETDVIKAYLALSGIIGTALGPMSPGTAYVLLHHYMGEVDGSVGAWGYARGGMGAVTQGAGGSFQASGGTIRTGAGSTRSSCAKAGKATGVALANGDEIAGRLVISNADVKRTFLKLVDEKDLPPDLRAPRQELQDPGLVRQGEHRARRAAGIPALPRARPASGDMHFTDSVERMERAYDDWKAGRWSADPFLDMMIPTTLDPTMTPPASTS